jgi:Ser/Thr protein kinase RdoA (MazF antagonist)
MSSAWAAAEQFAAKGHILAVDPFGDGNINDTYLVQVRGGDVERFVLQRINTYVFPHPKRIIANLRTCIDHVEQRVQLASESAPPRWEMPDLLATRRGEEFYLDADESFWRAISFIDGARTFDTIQDQSHAREVGSALGFFHSLLSDLSTDRLDDTLPGFHIMPEYLAAYDRVRDRLSDRDSGPEGRYCAAMIEARRAWAGVLEDAKARGELQARNIHGDPKVDNILISNKSGRAVGMVDLDTVKPGLIQYDLGDCLRSSCNPLGETTDDFDDVRFEIDLAEPILEGYLDQAGSFLIPNDYAAIYPAARVMIFEMGLRFFQDYLAGNVYFKVEHSEHNLERAVVQFKLLESLEAQQGVMQTLIKSLLPSSLSPR